MAWPKLNLKHDILLGINTLELIKSKEPTAAEVREQMRASCAASQASQHNKPSHWDISGNSDRKPLSGLRNYHLRYKDSDDDPFSSNTACCRGGNPPNPYSYPSAKNHEDRNRTRGSQLEGEPSEYFNSNRSKTLNFLTTFKQFMIMNHDSSITRDFFKKCTYFMGLIRGTNVRGWVQRNYNWLDEVKQDPYNLHGREP